MAHPASERTVTAMCAMSAGPAASRAEKLTVYAAGLIQGIVLLTFPRSCQAKAGGPWRIRVIASAPLPRHQPSASTHQVRPALT
jgi:hypothetical protein